MEGCAAFQIVLFLFSLSFIFSLCTAQTIVFRLVDGNTEYEGRVEVYFQGQWGTLFGDNFEWAHAHVVCRELGFGVVNAVLTSSQFGSGTGPVLNGIDCVGYESDISDCMVHSSWLDEPYLYHDLDPGIRCNQTAEAYAMDGSIRLAGGNVESEGRVELYKSSRWGTLCDDSWGTEEAYVVCRQLGYPGALSAEYGGSFDQGTGDIWFDRVDCIGNEHRLTDCQRGDSWFQPPCSHQEEAGVRCMEPEYLTPRLMNGSWPNEGRVEVWTGQQWERVCMSWFNSYAEEVVCHQLGYGNVSRGYDGYSSFGKGDAMPVDLHFICTELDGIESLSECDMYAMERFDCSSVSITCQVYEDDTEPKRLALYLSLSGVLIFTSLVPGWWYSGYKKKKNTQTNPCNTLVTQSTVQPTSDSSDQNSQRNDTDEPRATDEKRPPHQLPPIDKPPSYRNATFCPPSYEMCQQTNEAPSLSSVPPMQQIPSAREISCAALSSQGDLPSPSGDKLYEDSESTQLPPQPVLASKGNLPLVM